MTEYDYAFQVVLIGDPSSGKEKLCQKFFSGFFMEDLKLTIGVDFLTKIYKINGRKIKISMWVFGREERFKFLLSQYCKGKDGAIIVYDITNADTLIRLPEWVQIIRENAGEIPIILVGNKLDLEESREVSREEGIQIAKEYNLSTFTEISTKTGQNVENMFKVLTEILFEEP